MSQFGSPPAPPPPMADFTPLPEGWSEAFDGSGNRYYFNSTTNEKSWEVPREAVAAQAAVETAATAAAAWAAAPRAATTAATTAAPAAAPTSAAAPALAAAARRLSTAELRCLRTPSVAMPAGYPPAALRDEERRSAAQWLAAAEGAGDVSIQDE